MLKRKPKILTPEQAEKIRTKDFFDMILPGTVKFLSDHYIVVKSSSPSSLSTPSETATSRIS